MYTQSQEVITEGSVSGEIENNDFILTRTKDKSYNEHIDEHHHREHYYQQYSSKYGYKVMK
jgi:hypothetical protein